MFQLAKFEYYSGEAKNEDEQLLTILTHVDQYQYQSFFFFINQFQSPCFPPFLLALRPRESRWERPTGDSTGPESRLQAGNSKALESWMHNISLK